MSKYIRVKDLKWHSPDETIVKPLVDFYVTESDIADLPTIDIVNCIECAYLGDDWWCHKHEFTPIPIEDFFCKDGERIEE